MRGFDLADVYQCGINDDYGKPNPYRRIGWLMALVPWFLIGFIWLVTK